MKVESSKESTTHRQVPSISFGTMYAPVVNACIVLLFLQL